MAPALCQGPGNPGLTLVLRTFLKNSTFVIDPVDVNVVNEGFALNANHQLGQLLRCELSVEKYCQVTFEEQKEERGDLQV